MKTQLTAAVCISLVAAALNAAATTLPRVQMENGVAYLNGGIGHEEAAAMKEEAKHYPMSLVFSAGKHNEYLADVKLVIKNKAGREVLSTAAGPITLVKLPAGTYAVYADVGGKKLHRTVHVGAKHDRQVAFHWPNA